MRYDNHLGDREREKSTLSIKESNPIYKVYLFELSKAKQFNLKKKKSYKLMSINITQ